MKPKSDTKPIFRSAARRAGWELLRGMLLKAQRALSDNRYEIAKLASTQRQLKADVAGLHQLLEEYKK